MVDSLKESLGIVPIPVISVDELDESEPPPAEPLVLPAEARLGLAAEFANLYRDAYESSWESLYFAHLTHLGARISKHVRLDNDLKTEPRLYTVLLGPSARARKTQAIKIAEADFAWADLGHDPDPLQPDPKEFPLLEGTGSGEALAEAIIQADKHSLLRQVDEFGHLASKMRIEGASLTSVLLTLFDKPSWNNVTKGRNDLKIRGASLSVLTACVDSVFPSLFDPKGGRRPGSGQQALDRRRTEQRGAEVRSVRATGRTCRVATAAAPDGLPVSANGRRPTGDGSPL